MRGSKDDRRGGSWPSRLHRLADGLDRRFGPLLRASPLERAWIGALDAVVARQSDRRYMRKVILPALARLRPGRVLFAGVRGHTRSYGEFFQGLPTEYWTVDIDPDAAEYGAPSRHVTEDVRDLDAAFPPDFFDVVLLSGIFSRGVDRAEEMNEALEAAAIVLRPGGALLVGWNSDCPLDPDDLEAIGAFRATGFAGLPQRKDFADVTHVYAWFRKRP